MHVKWLFRWLPAIVFERQQFNEINPKQVPIKSGKLEPTMMRRKYNDNF